MSDALYGQWKRSRHGSHSGRGYHYQDAVASYIAVQGMAGSLPVQAIVPEGHEDISIQVPDGWIHAQAKSRREHRGDFPVGEVVNYLETAWAAHLERIEAQPNGRLVLILERGVAGLPPTGWEQTIADDPMLVSNLRPKIKERLGDDIQVERLLTASSVVVLENPRDLSLSILAEKLELPPQACSVHFEAIKSRVALLADENGTRSADSPAQLTATDVQRLIDDSTELVDVESLESAIRDGVCEAVDFQSPLNDGHFYEGVDVKPGHIVAGLTVDRPEVDVDIIPHLEDTRPVLIVGPSGAGKSAAAWMATYATRHRIRWYRVRRLNAPDVTPLIRFVRAIRPTDTSPIGLVVDELGRSDREGWDALVSELTTMQGVRVIGVIREEDLLLVQSAYTCHQVRLTLDDILAERLWSELKTSNATTWDEWREPYEQAEGLLLEYGYLLTTGERLGRVITSQVDRRIAEERHFELRVLRYIAAADTWRVHLDLEILRDILIEATDEQLQRALARLLDEHLVRQASPGVFGGLHRVRSQHIVDAIHRFGVPSFSETVSTLLATLDARKLQLSVTAVLSEKEVPDSMVIGVIGRRLEDKPDARVMISALQALRLVSFIRLASGWVEILEQEAIPPSKRMLAAQLAFVGTTANHLPIRFQAAIARMTDMLGEDLRASLLRNIPEHVTSRVLEQITDVATATSLLAALIGIPKITGFIDQLSDLQLPLESEAIDLVALFLAAARSVDTELASHLAAVAGGMEALLRRIEREKPWVRSLRIVYDMEGKQVVEGVVRHVSSTQLDPHGQVVELCRLVLSCVPTAEIAACRAVDVSGDTSGFNNIPVAEKRIPRSNLPSDAEVAWNRARGRMITSLVATQTHTERLVSERDILRSTLAVLSAGADHWCRGLPLPQSVAEDARRIAAEADALPPPPLTPEVDLGPLDSGSLNIEDPVSGLVSGIVSVINRLYDPSMRPLGLAALIHDTLLPYVKRLLDPDRWRLLSNSPSDQISKAQHVLLDLHAVIAELHYGADEVRDVFHKVTRRSRAQDSLARCARVSRERASRRISDQILEVEQLLREQGVTAQLYNRMPNIPSGPLWPFDEVLVLIEVITTLDWIQAQQKAVAVCQKVFEPARTVSLAPMRDSRAIASLSGRVQSLFYPIPETFEAWASHPDIAVLEEVTARHFLHGVESLVEMSAIIGGTTDGNLHEVEASALDASSKKFQNSIDKLRLCGAADETGIVGESIDFVLSLQEQVQKQLVAAQNGDDCVPVVALAFLAPVKNQENQMVNTMSLLRLALLEYDIEPHGARERVDQALQRLAGDGGDI